MFINKLTISYKVKIVKSAHIFMCTFFIDIVKPWVYDKDIAGSLHAKYLRINFLLGEGKYENCSSIGKK